MNESEKATKAKDEYVSKVAKSFVDTAKDARIKDMGLSDKDSEIAKQFISDRFHVWGSDFHYWDENREYDEDSYYEPGIEKEKFK